jgi:hypothetical protein
MHLSIIEWILMATTSLAQAVLFAILVTRRRWKVFPVFTAFMGAETVINLGFLVPIWSHSLILYAWIYYSALVVEFLFELGLVWEIARIVMRPTGTWVRDARKQFIFWGTMGILFAAVVPFLVTPPSEGFLGHMELRVSLFTGLVFCELIAVVTRTSKSLGLGWRNHVMALANGWTIWVVVEILIDGLSSYPAMGNYYRGLEQVRMCVFLVVVIYWMIQFWLDEPVRQQISPELRAYIQSLHERIKGDLDTLKVQG